MKEEYTLELLREWQELYFDSGVELPAELVDYLFEVAIREATSE